MAAEVHIELVIRRARASDARRIRSVHAASVHGLCGYDYSSEQITAWAEGRRPADYIAAMAAGEQMFVAEAGDQIVGFSSLLDNEVRAVYVHPRYARGGVGTRLLATLEAAADLHGVAALHCTASVSAVPFYRARGYEKVGDVPFELSGGILLPAVRMRKRLQTREGLRGTRRASGGMAAVIAERCPTSVTGDLRVHAFRSEVFSNRRALRVLLPAGYGDRGEKGRRYPVLYLNDGQNLFERTSSFAQVEWEVDETVGRLVREGRIPPMIVVGIDHAGAGRAREYLPWPSRSPDVRSPRGKRYPAFLLGEVMPFVNATYRTRHGPASTALGGSSLGAVIALYTVLARPGAFGRLLLESPSLFVSDRRLLSESAAFERWPARIYVGVGTNEAGRRDASRRMVSDVLELQRTLREAGVGSDRAMIVVEHGATHGEAAWARRLPAALTFLFRP